MNHARSCFINGLSISLLAFAAACGGGGGGTGGGGGDGGGAGGGNAPNVLGTKQDGDCNTQAAFAHDCKAQGGVPADNCQWANCTGEGVNATCFQISPPLDGEFSCDHLINCKVGEMCVIHRPTGDGCYKHLCSPVPDACTADPTCDCIHTETQSLSCELDEAGNPTIGLGGTWGG